MDDLSESVAGAICALPALPLESKSTKTPPRFGVDHRQQNPPSFTPLNKTLTERGESGLAGMAILMDTLSDRSIELQLIFVAGIQRTEVLLTAEYSLCTIQQTGNVDFAHPSVSGVPAVLDRFSDRA